MKSEGKAIQEAKKMSLDYGEMTVVYRKSDGDYGVVLYNDYFGDDGFILGKYVGGQLVGENFTYLA